MSDPYTLSVLASLAWQGDVYALRALEDIVRKDTRQQERYVLHLLDAVLPGRDYEITTAPVGLVGNQIRTSFHTTELFALAGATHQQRLAAVFHALGISRVGG